MPYKDPVKQKEYWRQYNLKHKAKKQVQSKLWRESNREYVKASKAEYERNNREQVRATHRRWAEANRDHLHAYFKAHYAANREKSLTDAKRWQKEHAEHRSAYRKAYVEKDKDAWTRRAALNYQKNSERIKASVRAYAKANPDKVYAVSARRRARLAGADCGDPITVAAFYKHVRTAALIHCHYCKNEIPKGKRSVDHVLPLVRGGKHHPENFVPCCRSCNSRKNAKTPEEFAAYLAAIAI